MKALAVIGGIVVFGFSVALGTILNGYALSVLWGWFVAPTLGVPNLGVVPAIGITLVVSYLTFKFSKENIKSENKKKDFGEEIGLSIIVAILKPSIALSFGWIVHLFM